VNFLKKAKSRILLRITRKRFTDYKQLKNLIVVFRSIDCHTPSSMGSFCRTSHASMPLRDFMGFFHSRYFSRTVRAFLRCKRPLERKTCKERWMYQVLSIGALLELAMPLSQKEFALRALLLAFLLFLLRSFRGNQNLLASELKRSIEVGLAFYTPWPASD